MNNSQDKKLYRSSTNRVIFGVCGGLGEYLNIDPIILRIIFIALTIGAGTGVVLYIILALLMPKSPNDFESDISKIDIKERAHDLADEIKGMKSVHDRPHRGNLFGWIVVVLGLSLLLNEITPWHAGFGIFWALVVMIIGIMILKRGSRCRCWPGCNCQDCNCGKHNEEKQNNAGEIYHHHRHGRGIFRLFFGLFLFILCLLYLVQNFNLIPGFNIYLPSLYRFWPVLIILLGLSLISRRRRDL